ncbi:MAG TPA: nuclear transport factor 2 family protein [Sphingomonadaceae bacterium]|nr:nuclear transport factor 2 family protein [Sphingomonadaceae bacterium]
MTQAQVEVIADPARIAADRLAIDDLHARYIFALNWQDADTVASLFAEDGVLDWVGGVVEGREAIRAEVRNMRAFFGRFEEADAPLHPARLRHFVTNKLVDIQGDAAKSIAYWFELNNDNRLRWPYVGAYGHYEDEIRRTPAEGWRFVRRTIFNEQMSERAGPQHNPAW